MQNQIELEGLSKADMSRLETGEPEDVRDVAIDPGLPQKERLERFLEQVKNPYCYRYGELKVKLEFTENGAPLQEILTEYLSQNR